MLHVQSCLINQKENTQTMHLPEALGSDAQSRRVGGLGTEFNAGVNLENSIEPCDFEYSRQTCMHIHQFEVHSVCESVLAEL